VRRRIPEPYGKFVLAIEFAVWQKRAMTLAEFLSEKKMRPTEFAARLRVHPSTVMRWIDGDRMPNISMIVRIEDVTNGRVRALDFVSDRSPTEAAE
jgi:predicted transcriptional regulator